MSRTRERTDGCLVKNNIAGGEDQQNEKKLARKSS
jgi:hypothetical protein